MQENINGVELSKNRTLAVKANNLLLTTLLCYIGASFLLQLFASLWGEKLPFLEDSMFLLLAGQIALLAPSIVYFVKNKINIVEFLRIKMLKPLTWILIIVFAYVSYPIISLCNYLSLRVSENLIDTTVENILENYPLILCVIAVALIPCIVEETIFRGVMYNSYKKTGFIKALIMTALLFGMFHMNINQMSYAIVIGLLFVCLNEATGSILSSIFMHFIINGTSIIASAVVYKQKGTLEVKAAESVAADGNILKYLLVASAFCVVILALLLIGITKIEQRENAIASLKQSLKGEGSICSPALIVVLVICVVFICLSQVGV